MLRRWMRSLVHPTSASLFGIATLLSQAQGADFPCAPPPSCPQPAMPAIVPAPSAQPLPSAQPTPAEQALVPTPTPDVTAPTALPPDVGGELARVTDAQSRAPFMIGDFFGPFSASGVRLGGPGGVQTTFVGFAGGLAGELIPINLGAPFAPRAGFTSANPALTTPFISVTPGPFTTNTVIALQPNAAFLAGAQQRFGPQTALVLSEAVPLGLVNQLPGLQGAMRVPANSPGPIFTAPTATIQGTGGILGPFPGSVPGQNLVVAPGGATAMTGNEYLIVNQLNLGGTAAGGLFIFAPQPGDAIGGYKISDNNSPMPRDRVYAVYNHFNHTFHDKDIDRGTVGVEKSFFCGRFSTEVRVPFAGTVDSTQSSDGTISEDTQLGNVEVNLKALLYSGCSVLVSGGLGILTPTADDTHVTTGTAELVRIRNETVRLLPFVAFLWAPECSRLFAQGFVQYDIDPWGNPVTISGVSQGRVQNTNYIYLDGGIGYYAYLNDSCDARIRSIAPTVELHYNIATENGHNVTDPAGITVGSTLGAIDTLNLLLGGTVQIGDNTSFSAAWVRPITDRNFTWEVNCALNIRFGPTRSRYAQY